jgi:endosialidase-like protein
MHQPIQLTNTIPSVRNSISRQPLRRAFVVLPLALILAWLALAPTARAVSPPPDGGYPGFNTAEGDNALLSNTTGNENTAIGFDALINNTTGINNTATGFDALFSNTTGGNNTANGSSALLNNTTGSFNTATGVSALENNNADNNTANGFNALNINTTGIGNTANGNSTLQNNTTGTQNTASGWGALSANTTGSSNTANGVDALANNTTGSSNIALGINAGASLTTGSNNIEIGNVGSAGESKKIRIGTRGTHTNTYIAGISGVTVAGGVGVIIDTNGHLGTVVSSERFKDEIKPMDKASEAVLALKPVTFRYKHELDPEGIPQFGLVAEQVEKVNPDLVARDGQGKVFTVRYEAVNAMLLNEFLKEHRTVQNQQRKLSEQDRKVQEQETALTQLKSTVAQQQKDFQAAAAHQQEQIEALTAGLQKVCAQVEMSRSAPQTVANNQ